MNKPRIGITMGDAAGIGAEIVLKALADAALLKFCSPIIIGDADFLLRTARELDLEIDFGNIALHDLKNLRGEVVYGADAANTGRAAAECIEAAVRLWREGEIDAIATAPISKKAIALGGYDFPGHTEFLAHLTGAKDFAMSFFGGDLRVVLLSTHLALIDAIALVKKEKLLELIKFSHREFSKLLKKNVTIAVAGLNPHASEGGMFGAEEADEIVPAIEECRREGIEVSGPFAPDTIFLRAFKGEFDAVVACYHDQATIAVKSLAFGESVNVTLGLPFIRTSVDHGTAFDIAGKDLADASSMKAAIKLAAKLCSR